MARDGEFPDVQCPTGSAPILVDLEHRPASGSAAWACVTPTAASATFATSNTHAATPAVMWRLAAQLDDLLPRCPDPGMALTNLERFVAAHPEPAQLLDHLSVSPRSSEILVQLFSTSQHLSEVLIREPELLDWLRAGADRRDRDALVEESLGNSAVPRPATTNRNWRSAGSVPKKCCGSATTTSCAACPWK